MRRLGTILARRSTGHDSAGPSPPGPFEASRDRRRGGDRADRRRRPELERVEDRTLLAGGPAVLDPTLSVRTVVGGMSQPIAMAFLGKDDFLLLEKGTGQVHRIVGGVDAGTVLDLPVNAAAERGLLGIALHPNFPKNPRVYLFWTESSTGADSTDLGQVPLLGNRVDSFLWNGSSLTYEKTLIRLRAFQADEGQPPAGSHNGGVIRFGPDRKLYVFVGDEGRRGWMQNLGSGPFGPGRPDDQFGGPAPDEAHLTGVVLRLNPDGSAPRDNPFARVDARQVTRLASASGVDLTADQVRQSVASIRKVFSYGHRNSIGMAFDPASGGLWLQENGDDSFSELNRVGRGENGGWIQVAGPVGRIAEFRGIETTFGGRNLQQGRWSPDRIADSPAEALARLVQLPGSRYSDPEFSWRWEMAPGGIGFLSSRALGRQYRNDLFVAAATTALDGGYLFRFDLSRDRRQIAPSDPRLADRVADNTAKHEVTESESLLFGTGFGVGTDVQTGPDGNLYVVSFSDGAVYVIARAAGAGTFASRAARASGPFAAAARPPRPPRA
ncbi:PQQ-dependent sugar dehydrogenase [Aquisphaera insulae]|uniref:PQQ-dependent sugar dehydrogenase n=1 Tax=Aquisphaera insulae TaxID=2712864 RepID=UPI0013EA5242|nr:PQQ-dependent sugar dehydrogenase [Aquisphaera insulae]